LNCLTLHRTSRQATTDQSVGGRTSSVLTTTFAFLTNTPGPGSPPYDVFAESTIQCPTDISLVGHNDMPLFDMLSPPPTTVRIQHREMGRHAARLLLDVINAPDSPPLRITLPPQLIVQGSTAAPRKVRSVTPHRTVQR